MGNPLPLLTLIYGHMVFVLFRTDGSTNSAA